MNKAWRVAPVDAVSSFFCATVLLFAIPQTFLWPNQLRSRRLWPFVTQPYRKALTRSTDWAIALFCGRQGQESINNDKSNKFLELTLARRHEYLLLLTFNLLDAALQIIFFRFPLKLKMFLETDQCHVCLFNGHAQSVVKILQDASHATSLHQFTTITSRFPLARASAADCKFYSRAATVHNF